MKIVAEVTDGGIRRTITIDEPDLLDATAEQMFNMFRQLMFALGYGAVTVEEYFGK